MDSAQPGSQVEQRGGGSQRPRGLGNGTSAMRIFLGGCRNDGLISRRKAFQSALQMPIFSLPSGSVLVLSSFEGQMQ